jgi:hypothetical protein
MIVRLTLTTRNSSEIFYARGERWSFHTAKTRLGHRPKGPAYRFRTMQDPPKDLPPDLT